MCRDLEKVGEGVVESGCYQLVSNNNNTVVALWLLMQFWTVSCIGRRQRNSETASVLDCEALRLSKNES